MVAFIHVYSVKKYDSIILSWKFLKVWIQFNNSYPHISQSEHVTNCISSKAHGWKILIMKLFRIVYIITRHFKTHVHQTINTHSYTYNSSSAQSQSTIAENHENSFLTIEST